MKRIIIECTKCRAFSEAVGHHNGTGYDVDWNSIKSWKGGDPFCRHTASVEIKELEEADA